MSLFNLFAIMRLAKEFEAEYEIFGDVLEVEDCQEWAKATKEATGDKLRGLRVCDTVEDCLDYLDQTQAEYLEKAKAKTNPSPRLQMVLNSFYNFRFKTQEKGFISKEDIEEYNEDLFNCLKGSEAKNFEPLASTSEISWKYYDLVATELYESFKDHKLGFMDKFKLVVAFVENYEGRDLDREGEELLAELGKDGIYNSFFNNETLGELFQHFADWCDLILFVDGEGDPLSETEPKEFAFLTNWRAL